LGSLYFNKGDLIEAEEHYNEALNISTDYYLALEHIAEINAGKGNYDEAVKLYEKVISSNPKGEFYKALADLLMKLERQEEAEQFYDKTTEIYDDYVRKGNNGYLRQIALFYADNDTDMDKALELASKDLEIKPDIYAYDTLAWVYYKRGDLDKAMEAAQKSMVLGTKDSTLYYHIGMIHHKLRNRDKAKEYLTLALSTNPYFDTDAVEEIRLVLGDQDKSG
jgi:tetratricopeptide (TPR) repeat protein